VSRSAEEVDAFSPIGRAWEEPAGLGDDDATLDSRGEDRRFLDVVPLVPGAAEIGACPIDEAGSEESSGACCSEGSGPAGSGCTKSPILLSSNTLTRSM
jgi:hypothetical protein